ncbi:hypothetical protein GHT07_14610 [Caenimonas koreensis DSM 17982]|uniref:PemK-like, MazF-like toxin of type II toxin-antitoxin system n=1 Tax=Caenimonas koreensis DSM 17982 TaxID=1121255 RepID=A0A844BAE7_9BURK|nr:hypothetical protein [Caenimonas koreensis]MRD48516.1 hypothetical protein [Caenimonas koreensis DSM 17982]
MAGDIVWCHFPQLPGLAPGPKPRPALVLEVREVVSGRLRVLVAYGTSKKLTSLHAGEFVVGKADVGAFRLAGLQADTKFCLQDAVELDFDDTWFKPPAHRPFGENPKIGVLHASLMRKAASAWKAVHSARKVK